MTIISYEKPLRDPFHKLLADYFAELDSEIPEKIIREELTPFIEGQLHKRIIRAVLCEENGIPFGFAIYQIDSEKSDWCQRPGWGFIREFYIAPGFRHRGYGAAMATHVEEDLKKLGASGLYLTSDTAADFWTKCGYRNTHEICSNDLEIFTK